MHLAQSRRTHAASAAGARLIGPAQRLVPHRRPPRQRRYRLASTSAWRARKSVTWASVPSGSGVPSPPAIVAMQTATAWVIATTRARITASPLSNARTRATASWHRTGPGHATSVARSSGAWSRLSARTSIVSTQRISVWKLRVVPIKPLVGVKTVAVHPSLCDGRLVRMLASTVIC